MLQNWPSSLGAGPEDREWLRLICMGLGILQPSNSKLEALNLPTFDYPTPVNCSVRMKKKAEPKKKKIITQTNGSVIEGRGFKRFKGTTFCFIIILTRSLWNKERKKFEHVFLHDYVNGQNVRRGFSLKKSKWFGFLF